MNLPKSSLKLFLTKGGSTVLISLAILYFVRLSSPTIIGKFFLFQILSSILVRFADLDISDAVAKRISESERPGRVLGSALALKLGTSVLIVGGIFFSADVINEFVGARVAPSLAAYVVIGHFGKLIEHVLMGELRVGETASMKLARAGTFVVTGTHLLNSGYGVYALFHTPVIAGLVGTAVGILKISTPLGVPSWEYARSLFDFFKYSFVSSAGSHLFNWTDVLLVGFILTQVDVGLYEVPWRLTAPVLLLSSSVAGTIFPQISAWDAAEESESSRIKNTVSGSIAVSLFLVVPAFFGASLLAPELLGIGFGPAYTEATGVLTLVAAIRVFEAINSVFTGTLNGLDHPRLVAKSEIATFGCNLLLNIVLILQFGVIGAAIATIASTVLRAGLNGWFLWSRIPLGLPYHRIAAITLASLLMSGALLLVQTVVSLNTLLELVGTVGLCVGVYVAGALTIRPMRVMIVENVRDIWA